MPVQLRFATKLTSEQYVIARAWEQANLRECPVHRGRACGFARHGTYRRKYPAGTRVARYYCRPGKCTFSLLPDCLASHLPGTLVELEQAVETVERSASQEKAVEALPLDAELPGALRWLRRRIGMVRMTLITLRGLFPHLLSGCAPTIGDFRVRLGVEPVLPELREVAAAHLGFLPAPVGLVRRPQRAPPG